VSALRSRLLAGTGANSFGLAISIGTQLASLPLFLSQWDVAAYGTWLMLSALPAYFSMADVGMVTAAGNRMTMEMAASRGHEANAIFQSAQAFVAIACGVLALVVLPAVWWWPWTEAHIGDARQALIVLMLGVVLSFASGLCDQRFKATQRYAFGTLVANSARLTEWIGWMAGLMLWGSFTAVALGGLLARLAALLAAMALAARDDHILRWGFEHARLTHIRALLRPAVAFMAFPLSNAISLQGFTLVVGVILGPVAVAVFNAYRTIARLAVQVSGLFSHALWPEFSRLKGIGETDRLARLARSGTLLTAAQALVSAASLYLIAPFLLRAWTHGQITWQPDVFGWFMVYAVIAAGWHVPRVLLMASNEHITMAFWSVVTSLLGLGLCALFASHGLNGAVQAMAIAELALASTAVYLAWPTMKPLLSTREVTP
jgi:O-antigen/teichoic acid export membrane protein